jgi:hypothetical protein
MSAEASTQGREILTYARDRLIFVRELRDPADTRQQHASRAICGRERRLAHGVYVDEMDWAPLDERQQYVLRLHALTGIRSRRPIFSHWSAAVVHGLPLIGLPDRIHVTVDGNSGRSTADVAVHLRKLANADVVERDGLCVTSVARTVLELAVSAPFTEAVTVADAALHADRLGRNAALAGREDLRECWTRALPFRGQRRALDVIDFADGRADSPIESLSRVNMRRIGCPRPELQTPFSDADGPIGFVDFFWPDYGMIGEADGDLKYLDAAFRSGRSADRVVLDEKLREDRLRALVDKVVRWRWETAVNPNAMRSLLAGRGLPMGTK